MGFPVEANFFFANLYAFSANFCAFWAKIYFATSAQTLQKKFCNKTFYFICGILRLVSKFPSSIRGLLYNINNFLSIILILFLF